MLDDFLNTEPFWDSYTVQKILLNYNEDMIQPILVEKTRARFRVGKLLVRIMTFFNLFLKSSRLFLFCIHCKDQKSWESVNSYPPQRSVARPIVQIGFQQGLFYTVNSLRTQ
jgi:hypothetical protein